MAGTKNLGALAEPQDPQLRAKCIALSKAGLKPAQIAKQTGALPTTVHYWLNADQDAVPLADSLDLASRFEKAAELFLRCAIKKARKAPFHHLMTGAGIATDKSQLLRGQPTSILEERIDSRQVLVLLRDSIGSQQLTPAPTGTYDETERA